MMRSMFSGVSGIIAHQTKMDVIGNNISNVNTLGFKASRVTFQEVFSQTLRGSGAPDAATGRGGTNPMQVGLGISVSAVDTISSRGSSQRSDNPTDVSINGDGFFVVKGTSDSGYNFTRAGNFTLDKTGNLVTSGGLNVYGWQDYGGTAGDNGTFNFDTEKLVEPINLYSDSYNGNKKVINAVSTTLAEFSGNLRSTIETPTESDGEYYREDNIAYTIPYTAYDSLGNANKVSIDFWKTPQTSTAPLTGAWTVYNSVTDVYDVSADPTIADPETDGFFYQNSDGDPVNVDGLTDVEINALGLNKILVVNPDVDSGTWKKYDITTGSYIAADDPISTTWHWELDGGSDIESSNSGELTFYSNGETFYYINSSSEPINVDGLTQQEINELGLIRKYPNSTSPDILLGQANNNENGAQDIEMELNFDKVTQFASDSSAKTANLDGYPSGTLVTFSIAGDGILTGIYSNGQQQPLGMIGLASFQNPAGLQKVGENLYIPTTNSGDFENGYKPGSEGVGDLNPGTLEMSNVDLSKEFTDMIVTQRGFQANGKIITTSDEMLQELVNLKR
ncbi:MAG: flagellar hook protein FlgE [Clostridiales bacterium]